MSDILRFTEPVLIDGVESYEFHGYQPVVSTNLNNTGDICINI